MVKERSINLLGENKGYTTPYSLLKMEHFRNYQVLRNSATNNVARFIVS